MDQSGPTLVCCLLPCHYIGRHQLLSHTYHWPGRPLPLHHPTTPPPTYHHYHPPRTIASLCALLPNLGRLGHRPCQSIFSPGSDWLADRMTCVTSVVTWSVTGRSAGINIKSRSVGDPACFDFLHTTFPKRRDFLTNKS